MYEFEGLYSGNRLVPQILDKSTNEAVKGILDGLHHTPKHIDISLLCNNYYETSEFPTNTDHLNSTSLRKSRIIKSNCDAIKSLFCDKEKFRIVEVGNDCTLKTKSIIEILWKSNLPFEFVPISSSKSYLEFYLTQLWQQFPAINVFPLAGNSLDILADLASDSIQKMVVLNDFAAKGNDIEKHLLVEQVSSVLIPGDLVQIDFELKNDPRNLSKEIADSAFKNALISELNEMLLGNFDKNSFIIYPNYNPQTGELHTCLVSTKQQKVYVAIADETLSFKMWDCISIESTKKYDTEEIESFALSTGFIPCITLYDNNRQICCAFWQKAKG